MSLYIASYQPSTVLPTVRKHSLSGKAQGTTFSIHYYAADSIISLSQVQQILARMDNSLSLWKRDSKISLFNKSSKGIYPDHHLAVVLKKALQISKQTEGLVDCTVQPLVEAWGFGSKKNTSYPDSVSVSKLMSCVGYNKLQFRKNFLSKSDPCVRIDLNGIAQGYTVDLLANLLESKGLKNYIVELGGEIRVNGSRQPDNTPMKIGIESPGNDELERSIIQKTISLENGAVTTSGSYRKYSQNNGQFITHIIDPRTGYPVNTDIISVTVVAADAITADGYDNALFAMGLAKALTFLHQHAELAAYFVFRDENGIVRDTASSNFLPLMQNVRK